MNELLWQSGERCREGDVVRWPECGSMRSSRYECTALGETKAMLKDKDGEEFGLLPKDSVLLHRAGEVADRSPMFEYHDDDGTTPGFFEGWQMIKADPPLVFRRLRQPAAPAKPRRMQASLDCPSDSLHGREHDECLVCVDVGCEPVGHAGCEPTKPRRMSNPKCDEHDECPDCRGAGCQPVDPPPAPTKPRRRMKGNGHHSQRHGQHSVEHDETDICGIWPACEPVDQPRPRRMLGNPRALAVTHRGEHYETEYCATPPACQPVDPQPEFEAVVCEVRRTITGRMDAYITEAWPITATVGEGYAGYTITAFCESKERAEGLAQHFRDHGGFSLFFEHYTAPMLYGKLLPFAVAVKVTK